MKRYFKKILAMILCLACVATVIPMTLVNATAAESTVWDGTKATKFAGGTGTEADPYQISNAQELAYFLDHITKTYAERSKYYCLTDDIYLNDIANYSEWTATTTGLNEWTPLSSATAQFMGKFDGQNHTVYGMYITKSTSWTGLFGFFNGATVKNLNVASSFISAPIAANNGVGGIVGKMTGASLIENCTADVKIVLTNLPASISVGGIAGAAMNGSTIRNCANRGDISVTATGSNVQVGGISGGANAQPTAVTTTIAQCYNLGDITASKVKGVGGILGFNGWNSTLGRIDLFNCYNYGTVSGLDANVPTGGIVGYSRISFQATNCFNIGAVIGSANYTKQIIGQAWANTGETVVASLVGCYSNSDLNIDACAAANTSADANTKALSYENGEFVAENMTALSADAWNLADGRMPTLKNTKSMFKLVVLGAQIRENATEFYDGDTKVAEGQGIRFGVAIRNADGLVEADALKAGYSAGIVITIAGSNGSQTINASKTLAYDAKTNSLIFTGYLVGIGSDYFDTTFEATGFIQNGADRWESDAYGRSIRDVAEALGKTLDADGNLI